LRQDVLPASLLGAVWCPVEEELKGSKKIFVGAGAFGREGFGIGMTTLSSESGDEAVLSTSRADGS
jgi:hypothetical protein